MVTPLDEIKDQVHLILEKMGVLYQQTITLNLKLEEHDKRFSDIEAKLDSLNNH